MSLEIIPGESKVDRRRRLQAEAASRRYKANPEKFRSYLRAWSKNWRVANPEKSSELWKKKNKGRSEYLKKYRSNKYWSNPQEAAIKNKIYREINKERIRASRRQKRFENIEKYKAKDKNYYLKNKPAISKTKSAYICQRIKTDINFRIIRNVRTRIHSALHNKWGVKSERTLKILGCDIDFFKEYIGSQFSNGQTWENYGTAWQIDHIIPVSKFNLSDPEQQCRAFHYSNCRPLCSIKNASRRDTMPGPHQAILI